MSKETLFATVVKSAKEILIPAVIGGVCISVILLVARVLYELGFSMLATGAVTGSIGAFTMIVFDVYNKRKNLSE